MNTYPAMRSLSRLYETLGLAYYSSDYYFTVIRWLILIASIDRSTILSCNNSIGPVMMVLAMIGYRQQRQILKVVARKGVTWAP